MNQAPPRITYDEALTIFGKPAAMAKQMGVSRAAVSEWKEKRELPEGRVWQLIAMYPDRFSHLQPKAPGEPAQLELPA